MFINRTAFFLALLSINVFLVACQSLPKEPPTTGIEGLTLSSDLVIVGKVLQNHSRWVNGHIVTTSDIQPLQTLKGTIGGATLQVSFLGGTVEKINEHVEHEPTLQEEQISVLFLKQTRQKTYKSPPTFSIVSEHGIITLVHPWERESRLTNNRRLIRRIESITARVQMAGGGK